MKDEYKRLRADHESRKTDKHYITLPDARKNKVAVDWPATKFTKPKFLGRKEFVDFPLD